MYRNVIAIVGRINIVMPVLMRRVKHSNAVVAREPLSLVPPTTSDISTMPRAGTRSQGQPSQTQPRNAPGGTQSQRPRRSRADADEDEEMEDEDNDMAVDQDGDNDGDRGEAAVRYVFPFIRPFVLRR